MTDILVGIGSLVSGVLYPSYMSFKALQSPEKEDDTQWLTYWVIFSFVQLIEGALGFVLEWIPFFGIIKLLATLYLVLPAFNGATLVYIKVKLIIIFLTNLFYLIESAQVKPALSKYVDLFDKFVTSKIQAISASKPDATKKLESTKQQ